MKANSSKGAALLGREPKAGAWQEEVSSSVSLARISAIDENGHPWIVFPADASRAEIAARHVCRIGPDDLGREVVLSYEDGDPGRPIILGLLQASNETRQPAVRLSADGEEVSLSAARQITLQCGKASITLTRAGKVLIRGAYVSTRSSGVNRIKGGSVQIN